MKTIEVLKKESKEVPFLQQSDFFTGHLSKDELEKIKGGLETLCNRGYHEYNDGTVTCRCGYDSEQQQ